MERIDKAFEKIKKELTKEEIELIEKELDVIKKQKEAQHPKFVVESLLKAVLRKIPKIKFVFLHSGEFYICLESAIYTFCVEVENVFLREKNMIELEIQNSLREKEKVRRILEEVSKILERNYILSKEILEKRYDEIPEEKREIYTYYRIKIWFKSKRKDFFSSFLRLTKEDLRKVVPLRFEGREWVAKIKKEEKEKIIKVIETTFDSIEKIIKEIPYYQE